MATNEVYAPGVTTLNCVPTAPTTVDSGDPVLLGKLPGVALTDEDSDGNATIAISGVFQLSVKGEDGSGNSAVAAGDILYYDSDVINKDVTNGTRFGYALGAVTSGSTSTIDVLIGY